MKIDQVQGRRIVFLKPSDIVSLSPGSPCLIEKHFYIRCSLKLKQRWSDHAVFFLLFFFLEAKLLGPISMDILFVLQGTKNNQADSKENGIQLFPKDWYTIKRKPGCLLVLPPIEHSEHTALRSLLTPRHHLQLHYIKEKSYGLEGQVGKFKLRIACPRIITKLNYYWFCNNFLPSIWWLYTMQISVRVFDETRKSLDRRIQPVDL